MTVELETFDPIVLNGYCGEALHRLLFEILRSYSEKFSNIVLSESRESKPFSLSGVLERKPRDKGELLLDLGDNISFRISILEETLIPDVLAGFAKAVNLKNKFPLGNGRVIIKNLNYQEGSNPWVKSSLYPKLYEEAKSSERIKLRCLSPTSFRIKEKQFTLPYANLVFDSLLEKWNAFSDMPFEGGVLEKLENILLIQLRLKSVLSRSLKRKIVGFIGNIEYKFGKELSREEKKQINALADFAFFAGVGYKTTMGMGQTVRLK